MCFLYPQHLKMSHDTLVIFLCFYLPHPGSHNAITYCLDMNDRSPVDLTQPDMLQKLDKYMKPLIRPFVYKWAITQVINDRRRRSSWWLLMVSGVIFEMCPSCDDLWNVCVAGVHHKAAAGLWGQVLWPENRTQAQRQLHWPLLLPWCLHHPHCGGTVMARKQIYTVIFILVWGPTAPGATTTKNSAVISSKDSSLLWDIKLARSWVWLVVNV